NAAYRMLNRVDTLSASGRLRSLRDANLLEQKGKGAGTYYVSGPRVLAAPGSQTSVKGTPNLTPLSAGGQALSAGGQPLSAGGTPVSAKFVALKNDLPSELKEKLDALGKR